MNGIWEPGDRDNGFYLTGGAGAYHLKGEITQNNLVYYPPAGRPRAVMGI